MTDAEATIRAHVAAFNQGDLPALLAGFAPDAVWRTGETVVRGADELAELFAGAISALRPTLTVRTLVAAGDRVACELTERLTAPSGERTDPIAGFYELSDGLITAARIYRAGSADVD